MTQFKADVDLLTTNDSGQRPANVPLFVVHTFEGNPLITADRMALYLRPPVEASYTGVIDRTGRTARVNDDDFTPWASMPTGNRVGRHWSLAGQAAQTRDQWLEQTAQLHALARVLAHDHIAYGTPLVKLSATDVLRARNDWSVRGVCSHDDISRAFGESDHTDPGPNFPWDTLLSLAADIVTGKDHPPVDPETTSLILDQLGGVNGTGQPPFQRWLELGDRTLVEAVAAIGAHLGIDGFAEFTRAD